MDDKRGHAAWIVAALLIALLLPLLYVLSVGPVVAIFYASNNASVEPGDWFSTLYAPLIWLDDHSTAASTFFEWYVGLWVSPHDAS